ncbi:MAG: MmcQ/YjbR family DNA-binding protein [Planctomycetota bacterium]|nr:MAG: MmcQ/YjbR family DNA-binding protein [Planctomycetota bacterium]
MGRPRSLKLPNLAKLRRFCSSLPETSEKEAWGHPTFRAGAKMFASFGEYEEEATIGVKRSLDQQAQHLQDSRFYAPPYSGKQGWIGIRLSQVPWPEVEALVLDAYRQVALKRMLKALDSLE